MADTERFEAFVREFQDMVYATAVRLVGSPSDAEDIAQTVFLRAFERFASLDGNPSVPGWLKTVTTNLCLNHLSRYRARWQFFSELETAAGLPAFVDRLTAAAAVPDDSDDSDTDRLERALQGLPDHQRVPLVLFHFEERSYQEIADLLGVSLGKVKTDIHRGRESLKRVLRESSR